MKNRLASLFFLSVFFLTPFVQAGEQCSALWSLDVAGVRTTELVPSSRGTEKSELVVRFERLAAASKLPVAERQILLENLNKVAQSEGNPYTLWHDVGFGTNLKRGTSKEELLDFAQVMFSKQAGAERAKHLDDWIVSEEHALFAYDMMQKSGLKEHQAELNLLLENNVYFVESVPLKDQSTGKTRSLVTYSFEKEGINPLITWLYRSPKFEEAAWMNMSDKSRLDEMQSLVSILQSRTFLGADKVPPTSLKPRALGGYSVEIQNHTTRMKGWTWEVAHKAYEISRERLMKSVREVANFFSETHSFHLHVVFELPKGYAKFESFTRWFKHLNDYQYLRGLEEGLHGNFLTNVANDRRDMNWSERMMDWFWASVRIKQRTVVLETMDQLSKRGMKFFSAGLRAGSMYGQASGGDMVRVGIELRDTTRNLDQMDANVKRVGQAAETWRWENAQPHLDAIAAKTPRLSTSVSSQLPLLKSIVSDAAAKRFIHAEPTAALPLTVFESGVYFNFTTKELSQPSSAVSARIQAAREKYILSLRNLEIELANYAKRGEKVEDEILVAAIRMSISEWAKEAQVSQLYQQY